MKARCWTNLWACFFILLCCCSARAQEYPGWFLYQGEIPCNSLVVGFSNISYYPDSSASHAIANGWELFARQQWTRVYGGQAFWSTEIGTFWMGADFQEQFDSTAIETARSLLVPLDTLFLQNMTAVLLASPDCTPGSIHPTLLPIRDLKPPGWIEDLPTDHRYLYAVGISPEYYYEKSSWMQAEKMARRNLARSLLIQIKAMQKMARQGQEVRQEQVSVTIHQVQTVARWRDLKKRLFYVLLRMPK